MPLRTTLHRRYGRALHLRVRPFIMWVEDAIRESGVPARVEYALPEWRRRFRLWYDSEETVAGAAEMLRKWNWPNGSEPIVGARLTALLARMETMIREGKTR
jgi:hypothetical protein